MFKSHVWFVFLVTYVFPALLLAQVNVESLRIYRGAGGFLGEVGLAGNVQKGNVDLTTFGSNARVDYLAPGRHVFGVGTYTLARVKGVEVQNASFAHVRWVEVPSVLGFEVFSQVERDLFRSLRIRQLNGVYVRAVRGTQMHGFATGLGLMSDYEQLQAGASTVLARITSYVNYTLKGRVLAFGTVVYVQPALAAPSDIRVLGTCALEIKLSERFVLQEELSLMYDTAPPTGVALFDRTSRTTFKWVW